MIFALGRADHGILVLERSRRLGAFTSAEWLTLSAAVFTEQDRPLDRARRRAPPSIFILDRNLEVRGSWIARGVSSVGPDGAQRPMRRLPALLERAARELTASWNDDPAERESGVAVPVPFLMVRALPLDGASDDDAYVVLLVENYRARDAVRAAQARYALSPRELEIVALLVDGTGTDEISEALNIAPSTVQDHIKRILAKTGSRNRAEMVGKILGAST